MSCALQVNDLVKSYNGKEVLHGITFRVEEGEIFGLLGSNGAGKTTTLECIEGLKRYDKGNITLLGQEITEQKLYHLIGIQLQSSSLPGNITVIEAYKLFCKANKVKEDNYLLEQFGLDKLVNKQYNTMSTGQKRRLHLALALVHNPKIIFLDEPTAGLDVEGQSVLHSEINRLRDMGKTIILTSHNMSEVEKLCNRIAILKEGNVEFIGSAEELISNNEDPIEIAIKAELEYKKEDFKYSNLIRHENGYDFYHTKEMSEALLEMLLYFKTGKNNILDIKINHSTLEDKYMEFLKGETA